MKDELKNKLESNRNINRGYRELVIWQEPVNLFAFVKQQIYSLKT
jgi:hypothetical protein